MDCEQKNALLEADKLAVRFYTFATGRLREAREGGSKSAYEDAIRLSEDARNQCEISRRELEVHAFAHGARSACWPWMRHVPGSFAAGFPSTVLSFCISWPLNTATWPTKTSTCRCWTEGALVDACSRVGGLRNGIECALRYGSPRRLVA
jgi:hypothetical protein